MLTKNTKLLTKEGSEVVISIIMSILKNYGTGGKFAQIAKYLCCCCKMLRFAITVRPNRVKGELKAQLFPSVRICVNMVNFSFILVCEVSGPVDISLKHYYDPFSCQDSVNI